MATKMGQRHEGRAGAREGRRGLPGMLVLALVAVIQGCAAPSAGVHPACFRPWLEGSATQIRLQRCERAEGTLETTEDGLRLFTPAPESDGDGVMASAVFVGSRHLGALGGTPVYEVHYSGGGTGQFSTVVAARTEGDTLIIDRSLPLGDRCNGGIASAAVDHGLLTVARNVTPFDVVAALADSLDGDPPTDDAFGLEAYDDMPACAVCCVGEATVHVSGRDSGRESGRESLGFETDLQQIALERGALAPLLEDPVGSPGRCFAAFALETWTRPATAEELPALARAYRDRCVPQ